MAAAPGPSTHAALAERLPRPFAAVLFSIYAAVILFHRLPPLLGDTSNWIYSGMLLARHLHGLPDPFHTLKHMPVPNSTLTVVLGLLCCVVPWDIALKLFLIGYLALCFTAVSSLARAAQTSPLIWLIVPSGVFLAVNFWYGFFAFQLGIAVLFFFVACLLDRTGDATLPDITIGLLLTLLFFTHMVPFTFACVLLLLFALQTSRYKLLWQCVPSLLLLVGYIAGRARQGAEEGAVAATVSPHLFTGEFWAYKVNTFLKSFGFVNPVGGTGVHSVALARFGTPAFLALLALNAVLCVALLWLFVRAALPVRTVGRTAFVWLASALSLPVYLLCPRSLLGISDPGSRILQSVLWVALFVCLARTELSGAARLAQRAAAVAGLVLSLAGVCLFASVPFPSSSPSTAKQATLPSSVERLANAPNDYAGVYYDALARGELDYQVFTTGIFLNRGALPTNPP